MSLAHAHERIMNTEDNPDWTRITEQQLADFIYRQPEAAGLEISSIVCRAIGCEIQILGTPTLGPGSSYRWDAIAARLKDTTLAQSLQVESSFVADVADRTAYITTLKRLPVRSATN